MQTARKIADSLYNAIIRGKCWKWSCKVSHQVHFHLDTLGSIDDSNASSELPKFRMVFGSVTVNGATASSSRYWHEVETEHGVIKARVPQKRATMNNNVPMVAGGTKAKFAIVTSTLQSVPWPEAEDLPPASPIYNMCSRLLRAEVPFNQKQRKLIGCISDETHRRNFYVVRSFVGNPRSQSLEALLESSSSPVRFQTSSSFVFNRRDPVARGEPCLQCTAIARELVEGSMAKERHSVSND